MQPSAPVFFVAKATPWIDIIQAFFGRGRSIYQILTIRTCGRVVDKKAIVTFTKGDQIAPDALINNIVLTGIYVRLGRQEEAVKFAE